MVPTVPITLTESLIPSRVAELPHPPSKLHLCGSFPTRPMVAIVGTRRPTGEALSFAEELAGQVVAHGLAVVSGGAAGIDTAAHLGALKANGQTLVVAPSGWHCPYPESNRHLFEQIVASGGGYVSLVEPNSKPITAHFFARNAVMVAMAHATVLIQAPMRSGARNAAYVARKLNRPLYVVPSAPWTEQGAGCLLELKLGARLLVTIRDLLSGFSELRLHNNADPLQLKLLDAPISGSVSTGTFHDDKSTARASPMPTARERNPELAPVIEALRNGRATADGVCASTGWSPPKVHGALLQLTLDGHIRVTSAGRIEIVNI
jgi:DNA processing protein